MGQYDKTNLKAILPGVSAARDVQIEAAVDRDERGLAEGEGTQVEGGQGLEIASRFGACIGVQTGGSSTVTCTHTLQRKQSPSLQNLMLDRSLLLRHLARVPLRELLLEPREIALAPPGVRDDVERVLRVLGDDGVVDDASGLVEEDAQSGCIGGEC